jgi:hypothetical protein
MKSARKITVHIALVLCASLITMAQPQAPASKAAQPPSPSLDSIVSDIQQATQNTNLDLGRLHIDRWKTDANDKAQWQQMADSLRKNLTSAVPDLITDVRSTHGSVSSAFKLYHNLNVVYEYLDSLTSAAGSLGKPDEYQPLTKDAAALDDARKHLSSYIEQAASNLEDKLKTATAPPPAPTPAATPKRIVVDDTPTPKPGTQKKKKTSPSPTPQASTPQ